MNNFINPKFAFVGICLIAIAWIALTLIFEFRMGLPVTGIQVLKRLIGWAVEIWFLNTLARGYFRIRNATTK